MPKFMNNHYGFPGVFWDADKGGGAGSSAGGNDAGDGDDQSDDDSDEDEEADDTPKYSQKDMEKAIAKTIAKERRKAERAAAKAKGDDVAGKEKGKKDDEAETEDVKARKAVEAKNSKLEMKLACYEAGVSKDSVEDVAALARAYMDADEDLDLEDAIEKVVKKYPQFKNGFDREETEDKKSGSWGQRQTGKGSKKLSGVESRFYELNPDLK